MSAMTQLLPIVGEAQLREASESDRIDGVKPQFVVAPGTPEEVGQVLSTAREQGWGVAPRGGGTSLHLGNIPRKLDLILDMGRLNRILEHASGDLVVQVEPGVRLDDLQKQLATAGQMLALNGYRPGATVGGVIAANVSGSRRLRYGTVRDLIIGVTVALPDGTIAKSGGKVVKNVAGYDLAKLLTGSLGTLGVIVKAIFRLHPRPEAERLVEAEMRTPAEVGAAVQRLLHSILVPSALELFWPLGGPGRIGLLLSGVEPGVVAQSATAMSLLQSHSPATIEADAGAELDRRYQSGEPRKIDGLTVKITCLPTDVTTVLELIERAAKAHGGRGLVTGRVGSGVLQLQLDETDPQRATSLVQAIRAGVKPGHVTVLDAPVAAKKQLDVWGPVGDSEDLMRRVKARFDPDGILNPGRFVGGI